MEMRRHSDMRLKSKIYTDEGLPPVADAVLKLPSLTYNKSADSQDLFWAGQTVSPNGTKSETDGYFESLRISRMNNKKMVQSKIGDGARYRVRTFEYHCAATTTYGSRHTRRHTNSVRPRFGPPNHRMAGPVRRAKEDHRLSPELTMSDQGLPDIQIRAKLQGTHLRWLCTAVTLSLTNTTLTSDSPLR